MKLKLLFSLIALLMISVTATYASFPVQKTTTNNVTVVEEKQEELSSPAVAVAPFAFGPEPCPPLR